MSSARWVEKLLKSHVFSLAIAVNMFSITVLMIILSFLDYLELAADVGLIQGATLAVFLAFSANARNLILSAESDFYLKQQFIFRGILVLPLAIAAFYLSGGIVETYGPLTFALVLRRSTEWIAELQISEREKADEAGFAHRFIAIQTISFSLLLFSFGMQNERLYEFMLFFWACSPVFQIIPFFIRRITHCNERAHINLGNFLPHLGSSWVIAVSTYVFRILIALLAGKSMAGMLFSAFAIGGMLNAIYTYAVGPSLISKQGGQTVASADRITLFIVAAHFLMGILFILVAIMGLIEESFSTFFLQSIGVSVIGGGIMILAQRRRMVILQIQKNSVFAPDVLANILIISTVPFAFYLLGPDILAGLFLWNACLTYVIYTVPTLNQKVLGRKKILTGMNKVFGNLNRSKIQVGVLFCLVLPVFFQLSGNIIFDDPSMYFNSDGILTRLPLPISVIACFSGLALLIRFKMARLSGGILFSLFITMTISTFIVSMESRTGELGKFILLMQFILPVFSLLLGQSYILPQHHKFRFEAIFLYVLVFIVPLEILATLIQGTGILTPYLYVFSIYQHFQYMPVIFVGLYFLALLSLFEHKNMRVLLLWLAPFIGVYAVASLSTLAIAMVLAGAGCVLFTPFRKSYGRFGTMMALLLITFLFPYSIVMTSNVSFIHKFSSGIEQSVEQGTPRNLQARLRYWKFYTEGILESPRNFMFGHEQAPSRDRAPSAHNYYLDLVYNFGFISLLPFIFLIVHTLSKLYQRIRTTTIPLDLLGLAALVLFFVLIDNSLKVGFRQPYPGIIMFFLWGVLLNRLSNGSNQNEISSVTR